MSPVRLVPDAGPARLCAAAVAGAGPVPQAASTPADSDVVAERDATTPPCQDRDPHLPVGVTLHHMRRRAKAAILAARLRRVGTETEPRDETLPPTPPRSRLSHVSRPSEPGAEGRRRVGVEATGRAGRSHAGRSCAGPPLAGYDHRDRDGPSDPPDTPAGVRHARRPPSQPGRGDARRRRVRAAPGAAGPHARASRRDACDSAEGSGARRGRRERPSPSGAQTLAAPS